MERVIRSWNLIKTTTLERKTPNTVCCANSIDLYYIMVVVLVTLVLCFKKLAGQMTHFQWTSGLDGWNSSECECNSTTRQGASFHFLILASPLPKSKIKNEIHWVIYTFINSINKRIEQCNICFEDKLRYEQFFFPFKKRKEC